MTGELAGAAPAALAGVEFEFAPVGAGAVLALSTALLSPLPSALLSAAPLAPLAPLALLVPLNVKREGDALRASCVGEPPSPRPSDMACGCGCCAIGGETSERELVSGDVAGDCASGLLAPPLLLPPPLPA